MLTFYVLVLVFFHSSFYLIFVAFDMVEVQGFSDHSFVIEVATVSSNYVIVTLEIYFVQQKTTIFVE